MRKGSKYEGYGAYCSVAAQREYMLESHHETHAADNK
jgi:hypothetical protein